MSSMPREALNTKASKPGAIGVSSSTLSSLARAITSCGSEISAGVILFITSAAVYPSMRSAPTLKIWMTPLASVAMLEELALLKIALCRAPALSSASSACFGNAFALPSGTLVRVLVPSSPMSKLFLPVACAWPDWRSNYADSKLRCEQHFNGVLELKSGIRLLQEVCASNKQCPGLFADGIAGRIEHAQVQPQLN